MFVIEEIIKVPNVDALPEVTRDSIEAMNLRADKLMQKDEQLSAEKRDRQMREQRCVDAKAQIVILKKVIRDLRDQVGELEYLLEKQGYEHGNRHQTRSL